MPTCPAPAHRRPVAPWMLGLAPLALAGNLMAQQNIKPPVAQAWIDVATFSGMGMPTMAGMAGMAGMSGGAGSNPMGALGGLFGSGAAAAKNQFGNTQAGSAGRWVDVTLHSRLNPALSEATQVVPTGFLDSPLILQAPRDVRGPAPTAPDDQVHEHSQERPRGKLLLYWGCGATVRAGQPKVLDMATATPTELGQFFQARRATQRGTHLAAGRPNWPNKDDARMLPAQASLVGQHAFSGHGVPEGFRFQIAAAQDLMPALEVQQRAEAGATELSWRALPTARAYFIAGMGANSREEMVIWTSSELPDSGFGLTDYQTNAAVDRWLGEKVLLAPASTRCSVPAGVFPEGGGGMLRMIAYGHEQNLAQPPRPADPKAAWEPVWAAKIRVKSVASLILGMEDLQDGRRGRGANAESAPREDKKEEEKKPSTINILRGILGR